MTAWLAASAIMSGIGAIQEGRARADQAKWEAFQIGEQKKDAVVTSLQNHNTRLYNRNAALGVNKTIMSIQNRDSSDRSFKKIQERVKQMAQVEIDRARFQHISEQNQRDISITMAHARAKSAKQAGRISAFSSFLTAGHRMSQITPTKTTIS